MYGVDRIVHGSALFPSHERRSQERETGSRD